MTARTAFIFVLLIAVLPGCASRQQKYDWGKYDTSLYSYYKDPTKVGELSASLAAIINEADSKHATVPPGIYAEYGYLQMQQGRNQDAVESFRSEAAHWPESKVFMDQMIRVASGPSAAPGAQSSTK
jgi:hypothetical protein